MSHLVFTLIILGIALARAFSKANKGSGGTAPRSSRPSTPIESEVERARRFREAVGLPPDTAVPPPVQPRPVVNPPALQPISPPGRLRRIYTGVPQRAGSAPAQPPVRTIPSPATPSAPVRTAPAPPPSAPTPKAPAAPLPAMVQAAAAARKTAAAASPATVQPSSSSSLLARLRDPDSIRQAIILREILGPPKALQPLTAGPAAPWMGR